MVRSSKIQAPHLVDEDDHGYVEIEGYHLYSGESKVEGFFSYKSKVYLSVIFHWSVAFGAYLPLPQVDTWLQLNSVQVGIVG